MAHKIEKAWLAGYKAGLTGSKANKIYGKSVLAIAWGIGFEYAQEHK